MGRHAADSASAGLRLEVVAEDNHISIQCTRLVTKHHRGNISSRRTSRYITPDQPDTPGRSSVSRWKTRLSSELWRSDAGDGVRAGRAPLEVEPRPRLRARMRNGSHQARVGRLQEERRTSCEGLLQPRKTETVLHSRFVGNSVLGCHQLAAVGTHPHTYEL